MLKRALPGLAFLAIAAAAPAAAQLRPYEPFEWSIYDGDAAVVGHLGAGWLGDQRASLAGVQGALLELGRLHASVRTGRVVLSADGVAQRWLHVDEGFAAPGGGALPEDDDTRRDTGDFIVSTAVRLTRADRPALAVLRFGTRLPTTDNRVGLERDATDFFATVGGRLDGGRLRATAELGVGIHGTRRASYEQSDVLVYLLGLALRHAPGEPALILAGHADGLAGRTIRGNEELAEVRIRFRSPGSTWVRAELVRGLTEFSPGWGLTAAVGVTR